MTDAPQNPPPPQVDDPFNLRVRPRFRRWESQFFDALLKKGSVSAACLVCGISSRTAYKYRKRNARFAAEWDRIVNTVNDQLEAAAFERAVHGVRKTKFYKDQPIGTEIEFSDSLTAFLLEKRMPHKYGRFGLDEGGEADRAQKLREAMQAMRATVAPPPEVAALRSELEALRAEVATLRAAPAIAPAPAKPAPKKPAAPRRAKKKPKR